MKIALLLSFLVGSVCLNAKVTEIDLASFKAQTYNDVMKNMDNVEMRVTYTIEDKTAAVYTDDTLGHSVMNLNEGQRTKLLGFINKFNAWCIKAKAENVILNKTIGKLTSGSCFYYVGDDYLSGKGISIEAVFMTVTNPSRAYYLILNFGTIRDPDNEFRTHSPSSQYLDLEGVSSLKTSIEKASIDLALAKHKKEKNIADNFK